MAAFNKKDIILEAYQDRNPARELAKHKDQFERSLQHIASNTNRQRSLGLYNAIVKAREIRRGNGEDVANLMTFGQMNRQQDWRRCIQFRTAINQYKERLLAVQGLLENLRIYTKQQLEYMDEAERAIYPTLPCVPARAQEQIMSAIEQAIALDDHQTVENLASQLSK